MPNENAITPLARAVIYKQRCQYHAWRQATIGGGWQCDGTHRWMPQEWWTLVRAGMR